MCNIHTQKYSADGMHGPFKSGEFSQDRMDYLGREIYLILKEHFRMTLIELVPLISHHYKDDRSAISAIKYYFGNYPDPFPGIKYKKGELYFD